MPERTEKLLQLACLILAALLLYQVSRVVLRRDGVAHLSIPALPSLPGATNAPASATGGKAEGVKPEVSSNGLGVATSNTNGTNALAKHDGTNNLVSTNELVGTNSIAVQVATNATNASSAPSPVASKAPSSNTSIASVPKVASTNSSALVKIEDDETATNSPNRSSNVPGPQGNAEALHNPGASNTTAIVSQLSTTNLTNQIAHQTPTNQATNATALAQSSKKGPKMPPGAGAAKKAAPELAPPIQARVDKIVQSEILGQIMHPMPMALLGIAGTNVFLRTPNGQTGMVKEGDELGGVKVLRIDINRVLVEEDGQKKELTLFSGLGSQSLLVDTNSPATNSKDSNQNPNETTTQARRVGHSGN